MVGGPVAVSKPAAREVRQVAGGSRADVSAKVRGERVSPGAAVRGEEVAVRRRPVWLTLRGGRGGTRRTREARQRNRARTKRSQPVRRTRRRATVPAARGCGPPGRLRRGNSRPGAKPIRRGGRWLESARRARGLRVWGSG